MLALFSTHHRGNSPADEAASLGKSASLRIMEESRLRSLKRSVGRKGVSSYSIVKEGNGENRDQDDDGAECASKGLIGTEG